jgi:hypothetical protein
VRKVEQFVGRWERARAERRMQRDLAQLDPRVRDEYLDALYRTRG